jgi:hypothetical protein
VARKRIKPEPKAERFRIIGTKSSKTPTKHEKRFA